MRRTLRAETELRTAEGGVELVLESIDRLSGHIAFMRRSAERGGLNLQLDQSALDALEALRAMAAEASATIAAANEQLAVEPEPSAQPRESDGAVPLDSLEEGRLFVWADDALDPWEREKPRHTYGVMTRSDGSYVEVHPLGCKPTGALSGRDRVRPTLMVIPL